MRIDQQRSRSAFPWAGARSVAVLALAATLGILAAADDASAAGWSQFRGDPRDGTSTETGLARAWGEEGPFEAWRVPLGEGF